MDKFDKEYKKICEEYQLDEGIKDIKIKFYFKKRD